MLINTDSNLGQIRGTIVSTMKDPHFSGYWITPPSEWPDSSDPLRPVIVLAFMDDSFFVRMNISFDQKNEENMVIDSEFQSYYIENDIIYITPATNTSSTREEDWSVAEWKMRDHKDSPLLFSYPDRVEYFFPATRKLIEEFGIPSQVLEYWDEFAESNDLIFDPVHKAPRF